MTRKVNKKYFLLVGIVGFLLTQTGINYALADIAKSQEVPGNLLKNPGFEKGDLGKFPAGWQIAMCADYPFNVNGPSTRRARKRISIVDEQTHNGLRCVEFNNVNGGIKQYVPVEEGKTYIFGMWMKCKDLEGINNIPILSWVGFRNLVGKTIKGGVEPDAHQIRGTKDWTLVTAECTAPVGAIDAFITIFAQGSSGTVWIDDISLAAK